MCTSLLARKWMILPMALAMLIVVQLATNARAVDPNLSVGNWTSYDHTNSSLPNPESVTALAASPVTGRLWVGTSTSGLFVFDGANWTNYTTANTGGGLPGNTINAIASFTDNGAWVATTAGVAYFNGSTWTPYTTANTGSGTCVGLPSNNVRGIAVVAGAYDAWFATDLGAAHYSSFAWTKFDTSGTCGSLPSQDMHQVAVDSNNSNTVWFAAGTHALRYNGSSWSSWTALTVGMGGDLLYSVIVDHLGHPWVTGYAFEIPATGVSTYNGSTWTNYYAQSTRLQNAIEIYALAEDHDGRIWIGADDGVVTYDHGAWCDYYRSSTVVLDCLGHQWSAGVFSPTVRSLAVSNDRVWMGINSVGVGGVSGFDLKWYNTGAKFSPAYQTCEFNTLLHRSGEIWAGCFGSGIDRITSLGGTEVDTGFSIENGRSDSDYVNALLELPSHDLLAASSDHGVMKLTSPANIRFTSILSAGNILPTNNTTALALDWNSSLWIGTANDGIVISGTTSTFTMTTANSPLPSNYIFALTADNAHRLWLGTDQGLVVYDGITMTRITTPTLTGNNVFAIVQGPDNRIWVGTTAGLNVFNGSSWTKYASGSGLLGSDVRALAFTADGTLLVSEWNTGVQRLDVAGGRFTSINFYNPLNSGLQEASDAGFHDPNRRQIITMIGDGSPQEGWWFGHYFGGLSLRADITTPVGITPPAITTFTPAAAAAGQIITVTGTNFEQGQTQILFSGVGAGLPYVPGYTRSGTVAGTVLVEVPNGAVRGSLRAVVRGVSSAASAGIFTPLPQIDNFNPTYGVWGAAVTVNGKNLYPVLTPGITVTMNRAGGGTVSTIANRLTSNQFRFTVPRLAATGNFTIQVDGSPAASPYVFYVDQTTISRLELNQGAPQYPLVAGKSTMLIAYANITGTHQDHIDAISSVIVTVTTPSSVVEVFHGIRPPYLVDASRVITEDTYRPRALIPGSALIEEGSYHFEIGLYYGTTFVGSAATTAFLHTTDSIGLGGLYMGAGRVELSYTNYYRNLNIALANLARMYPVADGIATNNPFPPPGTGVRYFDDGDLPIPCVPSAVPGCYNPTDFLQGLATGASLAAAHLTHNTAPLNIFNPNAQVNSMAAFYLQSYLNPTIHHPAWGFPVLGILVVPIEPGGGTLYSGYTLGQEVGHTFYQVLAGSPNCCDFDGSVSLLGYGWIGHSIHFSALDSHRAYNTLTAALIPDRDYNGVSDISYAGAHGVNQFNDNTLLEPYEYQWLYDDRRGVIHLPLGIAQQQTPTLMLSANLASSPQQLPAIASDAVTTITPTLSAWSAVGTIHTTDNALTLFTSRQVTVTRDLLTFLPAASPYHITYYSSTTALASEPLAIFTSTHGITVPDYVYFGIVRPVPAGTDRIRIASNVSTMLAFTRTIHAPAVTVTNPTAGGVYTYLQSINVNWIATDLDNDRLTYTLYDSADGGVSFRPIGVPVTTTSTLVNAATLVAGTHRIKVIASDGWNTGEGTSQPFSVQNHPPVAAIVTPANGSQFDQVDTIRFSTLSTDLEDGVLNGQKGGGLMNWYAEPGHIYLGNTPDIEYDQLPPGYYTVTLTVFDNLGLSSSDSITFTVLADFDGDGLPDVYENAHPCLHAWDPTDASLDSDHDGLSNMDEYRLGTDPCSADSDGDGYTDGTEFNDGSDPLNAGDTPQPPIAVVGPANITITLPFTGGLPAPELIGISNNGGGTLAWNIVSDVPWLSFGPAADSHAGDVVTVTLNTRSVPNGSTGHLIFYSNGTAGTSKLPVEVYVNNPSTMIYMPVILKN